MELQPNNNLINQKISDFKFDYYQDGKIKSGKISDYKGKWLILFFYPADFTFVCPTELRELAQKYEDFQKSQAEIISFSTDTAYSHKAWHDTSKSIGSIKFPMAADPTGRIGMSLGVYIADEGVTLRGTFIVDPEGVIKAYEVNNNDIGRSADELYRKLQAANYVREHGGEVCPASWHPGQKTLKPGEDLVGKI